MALGSRVADALALAVRQLEHGTAEASEQRVVRREVGADRAEARPLELPTGCWIALGR